MKNKLKERFSYIDVLLISVLISTKDSSKHGSNMRLKNFITNAKLESQNDVGEIAKLIRNSVDPTAMIKNTLKNIDPGVFNHET